MAESEDLRPRVPSDIVSPEYRSCFGCGVDNPVGLHIANIHRDGDVVTGTLPLNGNLQGFPGLVHGGVSASALDELLGYACRMLTGQWGATAKFELRYRRPLPDHGALRIEAGVIGEVRGRRFPLWAKLFDLNGEVAVEAEALFVPVPAEVAARFS